jgi:hypothetical protein
MIGSTGIDLLPEVNTGLVGTKTRSNNPVTGSAYYTISASTVYTRLVSVVIIHCNL